MTGGTDLIPNTMILISYKCAMCGVPMYYVSIRHYSKQLQVFPSAQAPAVFIVKRKLLLMHQH